MSAAKQYETRIQPQESALIALQRETGLDESVLIDAAAKGAVWVRLLRGKGQTKPRRLRSLSADIVDGSELILNFDPKVLAKVPLAMQCVSDHVNYGIWFKPSGMLCQGSKWSDHTVATEVAATLSGKRCHLVHRLDRAACGLLLIAYTNNALRKLAAMFENRQVGKMYQATVSGQFAQDLPLSLSTPIDGKSALTTVNSSTLDTVNDSSVLGLSIDTGRKHQIRRHLSELGYPILGDRLYARQHEDESSAMNLQLVACQLEFVCPFTEQKISVSVNANEALAGNLSS